MNANQTSRRKTGQLPLKLRIGHKTDVRTQFAALCWRIKKDKLQICLVTTRRSGRWILPKGWPMHNETPAQAAATEAWEEAGLKGQGVDHCLGAYSSVKPLADQTAPVVVMVYPVAVAKTADTWPEKKERKRKWVSPKKAATLLSEPGLRKIVKGFDPAKLPR